MADSVIFFKGNHPGWNNVTGTAEGSVRITYSLRRRDLRKEFMGNGGLWAWTT